MANETSSVRWRRSVAALSKRRRPRFGEHVLASEAPHMSGLRGDLYDAGPPAEHHVPMRVRDTDHGGTRVATPTDR